MIRFELIEKNDHGHKVISVNPRNVESAEPVNLSTITRIVMVSGREHIVMGSIDDVEYKLHIIG